MIASCGIMPSSTMSFQRPESIYSRISEARRLLTWAVRVMFSNHDAQSMKDALGSASGLGLKSGTHRCLCDIERTAQFQWFFHHMGAIYSIVLILGNLLPFTL